MAGSPKTRASLKKLHEFGAEEIVTRHASGQSIMSIKRELGITRHAWTKFMRQHDGLTELLAEAREEWADSIGMEVVDIADEAHDKDSAAVAKVRVDARKWAAERLSGMFKPKAEIKAEINVIHQHLDALKGAQELLEAEIVDDEDAA